ncbi:unnamed protein product [Brassica oleracea]
MSPRCFFLVAASSSSPSLSRRHCCKSLMGNNGQFSFIAYLVPRNLNIFISDLKVFDLQIYPFKLISNFLFVQTIPSIITGTDMFMFFVYIGT